MKFERIEHPLGSQRVDGRGALAVAVSAGRSRVADLYQRGAAKIRLPVAPEGPLEAVLINTAGGMTGGDRLEWAIDVGEGASAVVTTQACEKAYRSTTGTARIRTVATVAAGGRLAWLPQETILYDNSDLARTLDVDLAVDASALVVESVIFGRRAMGETLRSASFRDRWRIRSGGRLIHAEALAFRGDVAGQLDHAAVASGARAIASVLLVSKDVEAHLEAVRAIVDEEGGASYWDLGSERGGAPHGKLLARLVAKDGYDLRRRLVPLLALLNEGAALPRVWST